MNITQFPTNITCQWQKWWRGGIIEKKKKVESTNVSVCETPVAVAWLAKREKQPIYPVSSTTMCCMARCMAWWHVWWHVWHGAWPGVLEWEEERIQGSPLNIPILESTPPRSGKDKEKYKV